MNKTRMEAFSDGVIAIIITIMVFEFRVHPGAELSVLKPLIPLLLSYVLSFVFIGIYWSNHHHLLHAVQRVSGDILWANLHLLFWLTLIPFVTRWMGENHFAEWPVALYGVVMLMAAVAYFILERRLIAHHEKDSLIAMVLGTDYKAMTSLFLYVLAIPLAFVNPYFSLAIFVVVAIMWVVPDQRIEQGIKKK